MNKFEFIKNDLLQEDDPRLFELFHENSKLTPYQTRKALSDIQERMKHLIISFDFTDFPTIYFPPIPDRVNASIDDVILRRRSNLTPCPCEISLSQLHTLLHYSYGISAVNEDSRFPHPFRMVPSAGALYPIELYFHHNSVRDLESGLYHYNVSKNAVSHLMKGDQTSKLKNCFVQPEVIENTSLLLLITGVFPRSFFKYGERSYRFALLEAGHIAQNFLLAASAMNFACTPLGGFVDKSVDDFLQIDGVNQSILYAISLASQEEVG